MEGAQLADDFSLEEVLTLRFRRLFLADEERGDGGGCHREENEPEHHQRRGDQLPQHGVRQTADEADGRHQRERPQDPLGVSTNGLSLQGSQCAPPSSTRTAARGAATRSHRRLMRGSPAFNARSLRWRGGRSPLVGRAYAEPYSAMPAARAPARSGEIPRGIWTNLQRRTRRLVVERPGGMGAAPADGAGAKLAGKVRRGRNRRRRRLLNGPTEPHPPDLQNRQAHVAHALVGSTPAPLRSRKAWKSRRQWGYVVYSGGVHRALGGNGGHPGGRWFVTSCKRRVPVPRPQRPRPHRERRRFRRRARPSPSVRSVAAAYEVEGRDGSCVVGAKCVLLDQLPRGARPFDPQPVTDVESVGHRLAV